MKKLLIMTGVAAFAFGAFAFSNGSGFDSLTAGEAFTAAGDNYWGALPSDLEATVTAYAGSGETAYATRPAVFTGDNVNFLAIESASTSNPLVRYINESSTAGKDIGNGLYLDTLVKFTASTETMGTSDTAAKLAIWAQTSDETPAVTNFVVQAGYVTANDTANNVISTNYVMTAPANFDFTAWHRLTVKAIGDIGGGYVGFVVFVDDTALVRADPTAIADDGVLTLNTVAGKFATAVLPSKADPALQDAQKLTAVSFSGNGKIDDVSFTDVAPTFAKTDIVFTLNIGEGVTGFTLNGTPYENLTAGASVTLELAANVTVVTVDNVTYAAGYRDAVLSDGNGGTIDDFEFTVTGDAPEATISAVRDMFTITVGADTFGYATLAAAIADASKGTIVMADNYTIEGAYVSVTGDVVLDLAGNTLTGPANDPLFTVQSGASLTIINSAVADGCLSVNYEEGTETSEKIVVANKGTLVIGDTSGGFVTVDGFIAEAVTKVYKGKFDVESNSDGDECAIPLDEGVTPVKEGDYWVVDVGGDEPVVETAIAVPTAEPNLTYNGAEQTGVASGTGYTLTGNTATKAGAYTATATLVEGYKWNDETKEPKSINWTIAKKSVEATITLTTDSDTYDAEKKTVGDYTGAVTVSFGDDALSEGTDYTVTGLDATVEAAGEFTVTVEPVEGGNYSFESASAKLTVTAVQPPEPVKVEPGATAESDTEAAAKAVEFVAPAAVTEAGVDAEKYAALFEQKTSYNKTSGKWETTYELTAKAVDDLTAEVDDDVKAFDPAAAKAAFTGTPGIYYHTVSGTSVNDLTSDNNWAMAGADGSVTLTLPQAGGTSGFYKIEASATK